MKVVRSAYRSGSPFTRENLISCAIAASMLLALGITGYYLSSGVSVVASHLFYIPIVLVAYRYPDRGLAFAGVLAVAYVVEVLFFIPGDGLEALNALLRAGFFLIIAAVVSHLSARLNTGESRYRGIFETSGAGFFLFSPETENVEEMNRGCLAMLGYSEDEVPSLDLRTIWPAYPGDLGAVGIESLDCVLIRRDGTPCPVLLSANLLPDGRTGCAVVTGTTELKRMESRLRRSEETFRVILNTADVGILLTDPGKRVIEANTAAIRLFGGTRREDLIGRSPEDLIVEGYREAARAYRERVLSGETPPPGECTFRRLDGTEWAAEVSATHLARDGDAPERLVISVRDITERRRAEEEMREEYRYLSIVNGVVAAATASRRLSDLLQVLITKAVGLLGFDLGVIYLMRPDGEGAVLRACEGEGWNLPARVQRDDPLFSDLFLADGVCSIKDCAGRCPDSGFRVLITVPIPGDDGPVGWIGLASRLRETIPESERRILLGIAEELASAVVKGMLREDLEGALASANLYVDILTHDVNNANAAAMGYLHILLESATEPDEVFLKKSLSAVYQSSDIIRNVSTIRRLKSGPVELGPVRLGPVIQGICSYYTDARIACDGVDATVLADNLISEVFVNLIGNATKFGGPDVEIAIGVHEEGEHVLVTVADTGPGIPDSLKPRVFGRYERGDPHKSGKGLGLYIVRTLAERYGGDVTVSDRVPGQPEKGAAITFTLRRSSPATGDE
ncbi:sensor histidine kinase [Methanoculleus sp.]|uniref:sensor histidine kinase n=1 Tax=Methanoculleus sp. TaxID=90427 RepID=UPI002FCBBED0